MRFPRRPLDAEGRPADYKCSVLYLWRVFCRDRGARRVAALPGEPARAAQKDRRGGAVHHDPEGGALLFIGHAVKGMLHVRPPPSSGDRGGARLPMPSFDAHILTISQRSVDCNHH